MIENLVLFGASGDLTGRYLLPALAALRAAGKLPDEFLVTGAARHDWDDETFRRHAMARLEEHAADVPLADREAIVRRLRYRQVDYDDPAGVRGVLDAAGERGAAVAVYLALPPAVYPVVLRALGALPTGSRIVVEKPFGEDLESAVALEELLVEVVGDAGEEAIFRVDYVLGLATVQNLIGLRLANRLFDAVWSARHIEQIEILWEETLALEGRAGFYDQAGALKDVLQNHMFQLLCLVAMEPPARLPELCDRKLDVLESIRPFEAGELRTRTRRARYTAGRLRDPDAGKERAIPSYVDESGVDPARNTETFVELVLEIDTERWSGTRFVLRAGKALQTTRREIVIRFRQVEGIPGFAADRPNELQIGIDDPKDLALRITGGAAGDPARPLRPVELSLGTESPPAELPAYGRVLLDILQGGSSLSIRGDEAIAAWRVLMPVLRAWERGEVPMDEYPAGSSGPPRLDGPSL